MGRYFIHCIDLSHHVLRKSCKIAAELSVYKKRHCEQIKLCHTSPTKPYSLQNDMFG